MKMSKNKMDHKVSKKRRKTKEKGQKEN